MSETTAAYDSRPDTFEHIAQVRRFLYRAIDELSERAKIHDQSKLESPEKEIFDAVTPKLKGMTYGSDEYKASLAEMKPALDHHYANNRHHPEFHERLVCNGCFKYWPADYAGCCDVCGYGQFQRESDIGAMNLVDLLEMLCDWKAATLRHADGDILRSIEINQKRFKYGDELKRILLNTLPLIES